MCGIAGFLVIPASWPRQAVSVLTQMTDTLHHRGPDGSGIWVDAERGIGLGHRRLAIVDLSQTGQQPMVSTCGRFVVVFNGEIYNHKLLRNQIASQSKTVWRGHSDTEVLLAAIALWGLTEAVRRCVGMFAIALWDRVEKCLYLVRDRMGEKPLYYGWIGEVLMFGSELKALRAHPAWRGEVDRDALALMVRYGYIPAPHSIYKGVAKANPGTILKFKEGQHNIEETVYWSVNEEARRGVDHPFLGSDVDATNALERHLRDAISIQQMADVPLGAFLSGGIDSSTIVALMQSQSNKPVKTFTIGFHEGEYNEAEHAGAIARYLGTDHYDLYVSPADALAIIPKLPHIYDEPFADPSQIPTFLVSNLTREHVTVALSGDGGDELFAGYPRYFWADQVWRKARFIPNVIRRSATNMVQGIPPQSWAKILAAMGSLVPSHVRQHEPGDKMHKLAGLFAANDDLSLYREIQANWKSNPVLGASAARIVNGLDDHGCWTNLPDIFNRMMCLDAVTYLPDDILAKVDRASMAVGLETRLPLLDHRVVEFAWHIPLAMKVRNGQSKWLLRQVLYRHVPKKLLERPKMGFSIPLDEWLRGPLRDWAEDLLDEERLRAEGFFDVSLVKKYWAEHLSGVHNWQYALWNILMFQAWFRAQNGKL
jgi:asparagine synthase (glutamine-hydrolysing)